LSAAIPIDPLAEADIDSDATAQSNGNRRATWD